VKQLYHAFADCAHYRVTGVSRFSRLASAALRFSASPSVSAE
jgi:hypothetical protein